MQAHNASFCQAESDSASNPARTQKEFGFAKFTAAAGSLPAPTSVEFGAFEDVTTTEGTKETSLDAFGAVPTPQSNVYLFEKEAAAPFFPSTVPIGQQGSPVTFDAFSPSKNIDETFSASVSGFLTSEVLPHTLSANVPPSSISSFADFQKTVESKHEDGVEFSDFTDATSTLPNVAVLSSFTLHLLILTGTGENCSGHGIWRF